MCVCESVCFCMRVSMRVCARASHLPTALEDNISSLEAKIKEFVKETNSLKKKLVDEEHVKHDVEHEVIC